MLGFEYVRDRLYITFCLVEGPVAWRITATCVRASYVGTRLYAVPATACGLGL